MKTSVWTLDVLDTDPLAPCTRPALRAAVPHEHTEHSRPWILVSKHPPAVTEATALCRKSRLQLWKQERLQKECATRSRLHGDPQVGHNCLNVQQRDGRQEHCGSDRFQAAERSAGDSQARLAERIYDLREPRGGSGTVRQCTVLSSCPNL